MSVEVRFRVDGAFFGVERVQRRVVGRLRKVVVMVHIHYIPHILDLLSSLDHSSRPGLSYISSPALSFPVVISTKGTLLSLARSYLVPSDINVCKTKGELDRRTPTYLPTFTFVYDKEKRKGRIEVYTRGSSRKSIISPLEPLIKLGHQGSTSTSPPTHTPPTYSTTSPPHQCPP